MQVIKSVQTEPQTIASAFPQSRRLDKRVWRYRDGAVRGGVIVHLGPRESDCFVRWDGTGRVINQTWESAEYLHTADCVDCGSGSAFYTGFAGVPLCAICALEATLDGNVCERAYWHAEAGIKENRIGVIESFERDGWAPYDG